MQLSRRDALKLGVLGSAALVLPVERVARTALAQAARLPADQLPPKYTRLLSIPPVLVPQVRTLADGRVVDYYAITAREALVDALGSGYPRTKIFGYNGITPGPTIRATKGREVVVRVANALPNQHPTLLYRTGLSTHLHGSPSLPQFDGYASDVTYSGYAKYYLYPNFEVARTLWYHDHGVHVTSQNAYMGLAAQYHLFDAHERSLPLPKGPYDIPLTIRDAIFGVDGSLLYDDDDESSVMGDVILVNGRAWPRLRVEKRKYRFRLLNASVSRSYRLALSAGTMKVIATDAGLMTAPVEVSSMRFGMAERYEIVIDFSPYKIGTRIILKNLGLENNVRFASTSEIMAFDVVGNATSTADNEVPAQLAGPDPHNPMLLTQADAVATRRLEFVRDHSDWTINLQTWDDVVRSNFTSVVANPQKDSVELWELANLSGGWNHPIHVHLVDFKVLDRNGRPPFAYENGPKDVVYLGENETARVLARFGPQEGRYMIHCHNLVHEDHDMMVQFAVGTGGFDPINAAKPVLTSTLPAVELMPPSYFPPDVPAEY